MDGHDAVYSTSFLIKWPYGEEQEAAGSSAHYAHKPMAAFDLRLGSLVGLEAVQDVIDMAFAGIS